MAADNGSGKTPASVPPSFIKEQKLREIFNSLDKDKDGKIDPTELSEGFRKLGVPNTVVSTKVSDAVHFVNALRRAKLSHLSTTSLGGPIGR